MLCLKHVGRLAVPLCAAARAGRPHTRCRGCAACCTARHSPVVPPPRPVLPRLYCLQLGIRYSVSRITPEAGPKELGEDDFGLKVTHTVYTVAKCSWL